MSERSNACLHESQSLASIAVRLNMSILFSLALVLQSFMPISGSAYGQPWTDNPSKCNILPLEIAAEVQRRAH